MISIIIDPPIFRHGDVFTKAVTLEVTDGIVVSVRKEVLQLCSDDDCNDDDDDIDSDDDDGDDDDDDSDR